MQRIARARSVIRNFKEWQRLWPTKKKAWALYRITCIRPGYFYVGISSQPVKRIVDHVNANTGLRGSVLFVDVLAVFSTQEAAHIAEWRYWLKLYEKHGEKAQGFSPAARLEQVGHA